MAGERPRLEHQPQPLLGIADPGLAEATTPPTRASTSTDRSPICERDFGVEIDDLHRPFVDNLVRPNPDDPTGKSSMRRVTEVLDCWFESGSMPFAQVHYPFENAEWFESHYPGDFIVEYMAQTRGWFYTLHVLATALFDRPSFRTCVSHGIVLGDDGQKMSKSLNNYPDPMMVFDTLRRRCDALVPAVVDDPARRRSGSHRERHPRERAPRRAADLEHVLVLHDVRQRRRPHRVAFAPSRRDPLDQYILGKLHALVTDVTASMDAYDLFAACGSVRTFLDVLTNWYVRRAASDSGRATRRPSTCCGPC